MDLIDEFIRRYTKEYDYYDRAARIAAQLLEENLQSAGIRSIVTFRAKSIARLREKCRQRHEANNYETIEDMFNDIVDLAGVRVALYFPAEREQVGGSIKKIFHVRKEITFPKEDSKNPGKKFTGYSATHYRVTLREQDLSSEIDKRYSQAGIEIQVASILMHAWSEVEHDLIYKPLAGNLSEDEHSILDQLNGLVLSGEIALEVLQRAGEARVQEEKRFTNHYDLASHLIKTAHNRLGQSVNESGLGRVDVLFNLLAREEINTPEALSKYMENLHGNFEDRPLAEQIIDSLLSEDGSRYRLYEEFYPKYDDSPEIQQQVGNFITKWISLEKAIRTAFDIRNIRRARNGPIISSEVRRAEIFPKPFMEEYESLRRFRNEIVHGVIPLSPIQIERSREAIDDLLSFLQDPETGQAK
ncbi:RelA/SpoT family protein [Actinocorallia herbida]|uniref:RelA/SpoT family protein n=1 Tax=Actinocorallia herbida TaxID=58109 RepID=A0A3N1D2W6_9ACTN|nr:RelA/SpoT domain-containing protein [Actinocorallia herbida]ROO87830.1 RelA/SpoT family protein [Actinocorallia herbida]